MPKIITLPKIGVNMTEATIVEWVVKEGDTINIGDRILDAETDKAVQEIEATEAGVLAKIIAQPGQTVECQNPIAILTEHGENLPDDFDVSQLTTNTPDKKVSAVESEHAIQTISSPQGLAVSQSTSRVRISPSAKKLAKNLGLDYTKIMPSKPGGRITEADVLTFAEGKSVSPAEQEVSESENTVRKVIPLSGTRKTIAERMLKSWRDNARTVFSLHADASKLIEWRESLNKEVSYNTLLVVVVSKALKEFAIMNSRIVGNEIQLLGDINIGVAVDTKRGLMVPVIRAADKKDAKAINKELNEKVQRAQSGKNTLEDITGGTFTISNLGAFEIEVFTPVINPPECAIIGIGAIIREPVVFTDSDKIEIRPRIQLTLAFDHRIVDGAPAARFLQRVKHLVEQLLELTT